MTPPISMEAGEPVSRVCAIPYCRNGETTTLLKLADPQKRKNAITLFRGCGMAALLIGASMLASCANKFIPPDIDYDDGVLAKLVGDPPLPVRVVELPKPLPLPGQLKPLGNGKPVPEAPDPAVRVNQANAAARVQPVRNGFINAVQVYPFASGALYQVYTAPGEITDVALQEGEQLVGSGPVAAGDTVRWIIGDTESGAGAARKIHILVKPTRPDITTNLVINTDRRTYLLELRSTEKTYMASVSWQYPEDQLIALRRQNLEAEAAAPIDKESILRRSTSATRSRATIPPGDRCAPSTTARRSISSSPAACLRARCRRSSSSDHPVARSLSITAPTAISTSSIACSRPQNSGSATRTASGASASSAAMEGRGHGDG